MELKDLEPFLETVVKVARTDKAPTSATDSYFGGYPFVPSSTRGWKWPKTEEGKPFQFITQINFAEVPKGYGYPESGLLQVFVDLSILDADSMRNGLGLTIFFYKEEELDLGGTSQPFDIGQSIEEDWRVFWEEYSPKKIEFCERLQIQAMLYRSATWSDAGRELEGKQKELYDLLEKSGGDISEDLAYLTKHHHHLGGQPLWIQHPMLEESEVPTFMLQIYSDDEFLEFCDDGNMHIFGDLNKLKEDDVSEFFWNWDSY